MLLSVDVLLLTGSPNFVRQVYNASSGSAPPITKPGNIFIQNLYTAYWDAHNLPYAMIAFDGRSDYVGFLDVSCVVAYLRPYPASVLHYLGVPSFWTH